MRMRAPLEALKCPCCLSPLNPIKIVTENFARCRRCGTPLQLQLPENLVEIF
jgi:predicted amidophosphoribosyltransferase